MKVFASRRREEASAARRSRSSNRTRNSSVGMARSPAITLLTVSKRERHDAHSWRWRSASRRAASSSWSSRKSISSVSSRCRRILARFPSRTTRTASPEHVSQTPASESSPGRRKTLIEISKAPACSCRRLFTAACMTCAPLPACVQPARSRSDPDWTSSFTPRRRRSSGARF